MSAPPKPAAEGWWQRWRHSSGTDSASVESPENLLELAAMERMIERADSFRLAFAVVNHPSLGERLRASVRRDLGLSIADAILDPGDPAGVVGAIERASSTGPDAIFVHGLERLGPLSDDPTAIRELNLNRDYLWRAVRMPVVVWAPDFALRALARRAPDLWSIRSGLYRFQPERSDAGETSATATAGFGWELSPAERQERQTLLRDLLEELEEHGGDPAARASILGGLGEAARMQGRYQDAIELYQQALPLYRELGARLGEARGLLGNGLALTSLGSASASDVLEEAARIFDLIGFGDEAARARVLALEAHS